MSLKKILFILLAIVCVVIVIFFTLQYLNTSKQVYEGILVFRESLKDQVCYQII